MNGIVIINKPKGYTSHDIVYKIKKMTNEKVGHTGTLDPMTTGVLPILIGRGTLCAKYLINHDKKYKATLKLGIKTTTADNEGDIVQEEEVQEETLEKSNVEEKIKTFLGKYKQMPPIYSAIKVNGKKLYEYARAGKSVEIPEREVEIYNIEIINIDKKNKKIEFIVECSKGTYIRSLCEDIAKKLGTIGYMDNLQRMQSGDFKIENSMDFEEIEKEGIKKLENNCITIEEIFKNSPKVELNNNQLSKFLNGVKLKIKEISEKENIYRIYSQEKFIGIGIVENQLLKRDVIL